MKKKVLALLTFLMLLFSGTIAVSAADMTQDKKNPFSWFFVFTSFRNSKAAVTAAIAVGLVLVLALVFIKKLNNKLKDSTASQMINVFIAFYSVFGIGCLAMAFATDGATWSNLMFNQTNPDIFEPHFSDYIISICEAGKEHYSNLASSQTPFGMLILFLLSKFLPSNLINAETSILYTYILRNQTFMFLYLIIVMLCIVLIYRMQRQVLRHNELNLRDELVVFLTVVSYPTMYAVERGNILCFSLVLSLFFIVYHNSKNVVLREISLITLGASAAITPITFLFILLGLKKEKKSILKIVKTAVYCTILFITPCFLIGFDYISVYFKSFLSVSSSTFVPSNMSLANLLLFFGVTDNAVLISLTALTCLLAAAAALILPEPWQKTTAVVYIILNVFSTSVPTYLIFMFIPFILLLSQKKHKAINWLYLLMYTLLITPFPEWFYSDKSNFNIFMSSFNIYNIQNANNLISLAAVQCLFMLLIYQSAKMLISKKKCN